MSDRALIFENMFDNGMSHGPPPEVIARFDELMERHDPSVTAESAGLVERICAWARAENRVCAEAQEKSALPF